MELGREASPGGLLSLEKGTNCSPTSYELWLLRANMAKNGGLSTGYIHQKRGLSQPWVLIF